VVDGVNGFVTAPDPQGLGEAMATLDADRPRAAALGRAGAERARTITRSGVVDRLLGTR
jgi:hypothetical protein